MPNPVTLSELRALREKATQGSIDLMDGDSFNFAVQAIVGQGEDKLAEFFHYQVAEYIVALWNFFDRPSTQAMLEAGERKSELADEIERRMKDESGLNDFAIFLAGNAAKIIHLLRATAESNARDTERYRWVLPIVTGEDGCEDRTLALGEALMKGLTGDAAIDDARKAQGHE